MNLTSACPHSKMAYQICVYAKIQNALYLGNWEIDLKIPIADRILESVQSHISMNLTFDIDTSHSL